ncbi:hypothetical protein B0H10DRAFT_2208611 [Mycena sp. CBHHK59/15]|nr:hypothetical protein B0H10DRAFT_2208611 [Mycena sp. CBHHK59/15]
MPVKARLKVHLQQLSQHSIVGQVASLSLSATCNCIAVDPQDGYRIVVFDKFPHICLLDRLCSLPSTGRFWHVSLFWTLAVRFAWCDTRFDGVSAIEARERLEELSFDGNPAILQSSEWYDPVAGGYPDIFLGACCAAGFIPDMGGLRAPAAVALTLLHLNLV